MYCQERDNLERAMECYTAALNIRPNFAQSLNNMGVIFTAQGRAQVGSAHIAGACMDDACMGVWLCVLGLQCANLAAPCMAGDDADAAY